MLTSNLNPRLFLAALALCMSVSAFGAEPVSSRSAGSDSRADAHPPSTAVARTFTLRPDPAAPGYDTCEIEGWHVRVMVALLEKDRAFTEKALALLQRQLAEIIRVVPAPAVARLREVTLWFSPEYAGVRPRAEYHPGRDWLVSNRRNPEMVKGVEFTDVREFEREMIRMPNFTLHELAHAYHDRVLGFDHKEIKAAYDRAKAGKSYDRVERWFGNGRSNTFERAYAMTDEKEYFAESTEAFFSRNDFFPFNRAELETHDPEMAALLRKLWHAE